MFERPPSRRVALLTMGLPGATALLSALGPPMKALAAVSKGDRVRWPEVKLLDGSSWGPRQAEGQAVVAVFWSVTCPFCRRHNEHVQKLHEAARGKPLAVLGISRDHDEAAVRRYVADKRYTFPVTLDQGPLGALLAARNVIPLTVTVGRDGRLLQTYPGEMFEEDVLELLALAGGKA